MNPRDDETPGRDDEVAVTEASAEVLEELSQLFGSSTKNKSGSRDGDRATTPTDAAHEVTPTDVVDRHTPTEGSAHVVTATADDDDDGAAMSDTTLDPTPAPPDPLLHLSVGGDEVIEISDESGTAVIIDDESLDRVVIVDDDIPDPAFEERQRRNSRRDRLRKVKWFKLSLSVAAVFVTIVGVLASPLFAIREVAFEGTVYTAPETVRAVTELMEGASVFTADTQAARDAMLSDPWVAEVRITTHFPNSALVEVAERVPVVWYVGEDEQARVVDARGFIIAVLEGWPTQYLQVTGVGPSLEAGSYADDVYRAAAQLVLALPDELRGRVRSLELSAGGELSMILREGTIVRFGPPTDLQNKLVAVVVLFRRQDPASLVVVDVSTGNPTVQVR